MFRMMGLVLVLAATGAAVSAQKPSPIDEAFTKFFLADDPAAASIEAEKIVKSGVTFEDAWSRLKKGRSYIFEKKGEFSLRWKSSTGPYFNNVVDVPASYDPARKWPLRVQLHGGIGRPSPNAVRPGQDPDADGSSPPNRIAGEPQIYAHPSGWADAQWWDAEQVENILRLVDTLKRRYNVDESRIYLTGISDGGTGVYYLAMKSPTTGRRTCRSTAASPCSGTPPRRRRRALRQQPHRRAAVHRERRAGSAVSRVAGRAACRVVQAAWRPVRLPPAGRRRAQHGVVADGTRAL